MYIVGAVGDFENALFQLQLLIFPFLFSSVVVC